MTPEERAAQAIPPTYTEWEYAELLQQVARAIRQAIEDERDACTRLAAVMGMLRQSDAGMATEREHAEARVAARIVAAIQARSSSA